MSAHDEVWKNLDCEKSATRKVDWPAVRRALTSLPYPENVEVVMETAFAMRSTMDLDAEAELCVMGVSSVFYYVTLSRPQCSDAKLGRLVRTRRERQPRHYVGVQPEGGPLGVFFS